MARLSATDLRRKLLSAGVAAPVLAAWSLQSPSSAQAAIGPWPTKPIRIVVPFPTGGVADLFSRTIGVKLQELWGQPVVVENRPGAGGNIGAEVVAKSAPDGYNLVMGNIGTHAVNPSLFKNMPFDSLKDFAPIALVIEAEGLLVVPASLSIRSISDLLDQARSNPGKLSYASAGVGTASHLAGELFKTMGKVDITHVPYKGNVPALNDLIGAQTTMLFGTMPTVMPHVRSGKLRAIAVVGNERAVALPDIPTVAESGLNGFEASNWIGLFGPAGLPVEIIGKLNAEVMRIMQLPEVQARLTSEGARFTRNTPAQFAAFVQNEAGKWGKVIRDAGIKPE